MPMSRLTVFKGTMVKLVRNGCPSLSVFVVLLVLFELLQHSANVLCYTRSDFPPDFIFGSATSALQVEGAAFEDGKSPGVIETLLGEAGYNLNISCDQYRKYKEDVQLMVNIGLDAYRFSISWSRLIPSGRGSVNPKGVEYYNGLINELIINGIQPHATLMHSDMPLALYNAYGGSMLSQQFVEDFTAYADVCFREFGDRVLHWTTFNEANMQAAYNPFGSPDEPYTLAHNYLLAHASVVRLYREKYQRKQHGFIGINVYTTWFVPQTDRKDDLLATQRARDYVIGWLIHPLVFGDYTNSLKSDVGAKLPSFTENESKLVKRSFDFIGVNCYCATAVEDDPSSFDKDVRDFNTDMAAKFHSKDVGGEFVQGILDDFKRVYGNPPVYIQENGFRTLRESSLSDLSRIEFLNASLGSLLNAVRNGSNVMGYFQWSLLDVFEWLGNYKYGFGLYYVDLDDPNRERYPKLSADWYSKFLKGNSSSNSIVQHLSNSSVISTGVLDH